MKNYFRNKNGKRIGFIDGHRYYGEDGSIYEFNGKDVYDPSSHIIYYSVTDDGKVWDCRNKMSYSLNSDGSVSSVDHNVVGRFDAEIPLPFGSGSASCSDEEEILFFIFKVLFIYGCFAIWPSMFEAYDPNDTNSIYWIICCLFFVVYHLLATFGVLYFAYANEGVYNEFAWRLMFISPFAFVYFIYILSGQFFYSVFIGVLLSGIPFGVQYISLIVKDRFIK